MLWRGRSLDQLVALPVYCFMYWSSEYVSCVCACVCVCVCFVLVVLLPYLCLESRSEVYRSVYIPSLVLLFDQPKLAVARGLRDFVNRF